MGDLSTYELSHFIPFTAEVYDRLFVRHNAAWSPLPALTVALGFFALWAALRGRGRWLGVALAAAWAWVGYAFLYDIYGTLNWAGEYFAYGFWVQSGILLAMGLGGWLDAPAGPRVFRGIGAAIAMWGLAIHPLIAPLAGRDWAGVELFGHAPEPTALVTLGLALMVARSRLLAMLAPALWMVIAAATAWVLDGPAGLVAPVVAALALAAAVARFVAERRARGA